MNLESLKPTSDTADALRHAADVLADAQRLNAALDRVTAEITTAKASQEQALNARAELDAELAMCDDTAAAKGLEGKVKKADTAVTEAKAALERAQRVDAALRQRLVQAETSIAGEVGVVEVVARQHAQAAHEAIAEDLKAAVQPLIDALRRAHVLRQATHSPHLVETLAKVMVPDPTSIFRPLIEGDRIAAGDRQAPITEGWRDDPALVSLHDGAKVVRDALAGLQSYVPRAERERKAVPYIRKGESNDGDLTQNAMRARGQAQGARHAAAASAPTVDPNRAAALRASATCASDGGGSEFSPLTYAGMN